jgi:hypothetical protein
MCERWSQQNGITDMSASRTLLRRRTKERVTLPNGQVVFADIEGRPLRTKVGTPFRRVTTLRHPAADAPFEVSYHATKGLRIVRVAV